MSRLRTAAALAGVLWLGTGCQVSPATRLQRAHDANFERQPRQALKQYRLALDALEKDDAPDARVLKAQALRGLADTFYLELHDITQAVSTYKELIAQCPEAKETLDARIQLADILRVYYHNLRGAIAELEAAIERNPPQSAELSYLVAKLYFEVGDYQQAQLESQKLIKKYETSSFVDDAMMLEAQSLGMQEGMKAEAAKTYQALVARFPDSELAPHALFELGKLKAEAGENEQAIDIWVQALKHHPDPKLVQASISRIRKRITETTPVAIGQKAAFAKPDRARVPNTNHKTSIEAVGGSASEAKHDYGD